MVCFILPEHWAIRDCVLELSMVTKKGQCPLGFLWRGRGLSKLVMMVGLAALCLLIFIKILSLLFAFAISLGALFLIALSMWFVGKGLFLLKEIFGAQKRTRTSTK